MKNLIFIISVVVVMSSCQKEGHMYKCCYTTPNSWMDQNHTSKYVTTNFFFREDKDSIGAVNWYKQTEAYAEISTRCDSMWIEYWGTYEDWTKNGR